MQDWIRGRIPFFVRPPDLPASEQKSKPVGAPIPVKEGFEIDRTAQVKGVQQPLHQIVHSNKFLADDEQKLDPAEEELEVVVNDLEGEIEEQEAEDDEWTGFGEEASEANESKDEIPSWEEVMGLETAPKEDDAELEEEIDDILGEVFASDADDQESDDVEIVLEEESKSVGNPDLKLSKSKRGRFLSVFNTLESHVS